MDTKKIKAVKATVKNFAPFGQFISTGNKKADSVNPGFSFWNALGAVKIKGETSVSIVKAAPQKKLEENGMERHLKTSEIIIASADMVVVTTLSDAKNPKLPDPAKVKAFYVNRGDAVIFAPGAWHHAPLAVKEKGNFYIIFDRVTPDKDFYYVDLPKQVGFVWEVTL
jgi:ureidoglycolate hydrolase